MARTHNIFGFETGRHSRLRCHDDFLASAADFCIFCPVSGGSTSRAALQGRHLLHILGTSRVWLLFLRELLDDFREFDYLLSLHAPRRQTLLFAEESLTRSSKLRESVAHHLFVAINICDSHLLEFIYLFLRHSVIVVALLRT